MSSEEAWLHNQYEPGDNRPLAGNPVHIDKVLKRIQNQSFLNYLKMEFGNWKIGNHPSTVVSDTKVTNTNFPIPPNHGESKDETDYYGGHLVAESIGNPEMAKLIAAAPEMLKVLMLFVERQERGWHINLAWNQDTRDKIKAVIEKAVGNV